MSPRPLAKAKCRVRLGLAAMASGLSGSARMRSAPSKRSASTMRCRVGLKYGWWRLTSFRTLGERTWSVLREEVEAEEAVVQEEVAEDSEASDESEDSEETELTRWRPPEQRVKSRGIGA